MVKNRQPVKTEQDSKKNSSSLAIWIPVIVAIIGVAGTITAAIINNSQTPATSTPVATISAVPSDTPTAINTSTPCPVDMVYIKEGEFIFGALDSDPDARDDEKPSHNIYLDAFCIDRTEVSNQTYAKFAETLGISWAVNDLPAVKLIWNDAKAYCKSLERELPTEYQWEKAARGEDGRIFPWGEDRQYNRANIENFQYKLSSVNDFQAGASPYGLLNMAGNAAEWTSDWYDSDWYLQLPDFGKNPRGPLEPGESGTIVVRGGDLGETWKNARTTARFGGVSPDQAGDFLGFRCASQPLR